MNNFTPPVWLTATYIECLLRDHLGETSLSVLRFKALPAVRPGENYASELLRVGVHFRRCTSVLDEEHRSLIFKLGLQDASASALLEEFDALSKEMGMYVNILPACQRLLTEIEPGTTFFATTYAADNVNRAIIFEDLREAGFRLADRKRGLDGDHARAGVAKLARLHATSMLLYAQDPGMFDRFHDGMTARKSKPTLAFWMTILDGLIVEMKEWEGFDKYTKKVERMREHFVETGCRVFEGDENETKVLLHGDFWTNNIMFKYDDGGRIVDVVLIDFQICSVSSPVIDLIYFASTSVIDGFKKFDEILKFYYKHFSGLLKRLNYLGRVPTLYELRGESQAKGFYWFFAKAILGALIFNENEECANLQTIMGNDEESKQLRTRMFKSPSYRSGLCELLPQLDKIGLLDPIHSI